ncbi:MAG: hypothetical protein ACRD5Z_09205 [Bryobacteraceae bacterium]
MNEIDTARAGPQLRLKLFGKMIQAKQGSLEIQAWEFDRGELKRGNVQSHIGLVISKDISEPLHGG